MSPSGGRPQHAVLPLIGRGELPFALLHGRPLHVHAALALLALGDREVTVVVEPGDEDRVRRDLARVAPALAVRGHHDWWRGVGADPTDVLVHDPLCPLASPDFLGAVAAESARAGASAAAFRPVTDTVKTVVDGRIHGTIDREGLAGLISPIVVARTVVELAAGGGAPPLGDFAELLTWLRARGPVVLVKGPSLARRVDDVSAVNLLECVDELSRQVRADPGPTRVVAVSDG